MLNFIAFCNNSNVYPAGNDKSGKASEGVSVMTNIVGIVKYKEKYKSLQEAVDISGAFKNLPGNAKVVIKPNIVFWSKKIAFPKWGVITTSRIVEDTVRLLKDHGAGEITIVEGAMGVTPYEKNVTEAAFEGLGYNRLKERYGVKCCDVFTRPFEKVDLGDGIILNCNSDIVHSDFVVNLPVLKTHAQAKVSLGLKNLKGVLNYASRKMCHSADIEKNLDYMISKLPGMLPPSATILDGIYTLERGPAFDGKPRKSGLIIASSDILSADMAGAKVLGYDPAEVKSIALAAQDQGRPADLSDVEVRGEKISDVASFHEYTFPYNEDNTLPLKLHNMGLKGINYYKYDDSLCTYCSSVNGVIIMAVSMAWKGEPWDNVEVLIGKRAQPRPGMNKTILLGKCMCELHRNNPVIKEAVPIKGCPPEKKDVVAALHKAGIAVEQAIFDNIDMGPAYFMARYADKPEFDESFYMIE